MEAFADLQASQDITVLRVIVDQRQHGPDIACIDEAIFNDRRELSAFQGLLHGHAIVLYLVRHVRTVGTSFRPLRRLRRYLFHQY